MLYFLVPVAYDVHLNWVKHDMRFRHSGNGSGLGFGYRGDESNHKYVRLTGLNAVLHSFPRFGPEISGTSWPAPDVGFSE